VLLHFYRARVVTRSRRFESWSQFYDRELITPRVAYLGSAFLSPKFFLSTFINAQAYYNSGVVVVNSKVDGFGFWTKRFFLQFVSVG
jgi:hypothetical protein